jgi:AraC-like DNA-binding protein
MSESATSQPMSDGPSVPSAASITPPKGRPHWLPDRATSLELRYLSWGYRWYGDVPVGSSSHDGWHYFMVLEGSPTLLVREQTVRMRPGMVSICDPECPVGHRDQPKHRCCILTWIWKSQPTHSALRPNPGDFIKISLDKDRLRRLKNLHTQCREAVANTNERSMLQLQVARLQIDLCLLDAREHRQTADENFRLNLAMKYVRDHLDEPEPIKHLCKYLQISGASLRRLFHEHTGKSPRAFALDWRMQWAREQLLPAQASVKSVAYALGYRHPNDFSRAFKRYYGLTASRILQQPQRNGLNSNRPGAVVAGNDNSVGIKL